MTSKTALHGGKLKVGRLAVIMALALLTPHAAHARAPISDAQVRQEVIRESIAAYQATGHPCACPYNAARSGSSCGRRSAYSRPGGAAPLCYPGDVTSGMVTDWRAAHPGE